MTDELRIDERPQLERPVLIAAFRGWNDGGQGASLAGAYLAQAWAAEQFADDRPGELLRLPGDAADGLARRRRSRARSTGPRTPSCTRRCRAPAATRSSCSASSRTSAGARSASTSPSLADELRRRAGDHARLAARRRAAHAAGAGDGQRDRSGADRAARPAGVALRGADRDRRRAARRVRAARASPSASLWAAVPHYVSLTPSPRAAKALVDRLGDAARRRRRHAPSSTRPPTRTRSR